MSISAGARRFVNATRPGRLGPLLAASALLLAGCGSSSFSYQPTLSCLRKQHRLRLSKRVDFVASTALAGAFRVWFKRNEVTISFSPSPARAAGIAHAYRRLHGPTIGIADVLFLERNVTLLWALHPSYRDLKLVSGCLK